MLSRDEIKNAFEQIRVRLDIRTRIQASVSKIERLSRSHEELENHLGAIHKKAVVADKQKKVQEFVDASNKCFIAIDEEKKSYKRLLDLQSFIGKIVTDVNAIEGETLSVKDGLIQADVNNLNIAVNNLLDPYIELTESKVCFFESFLEELMIENVGKPFYFSEEEIASFAIGGKIEIPEIKQEIPEEYNPFDDVSPEAVNEALEQLMLAELAEEANNTRLNAANRQNPRNRYFSTTNYSDAFFSVNNETETFEFPIYPTPEFKRS